MGAEFSHLNIANVREVIACELMDVLVLYHEVMDQKAEFRGTNLELEPASRLEKEQKEQGEGGWERKEETSSKQRHDMNRIEEGHEHEGGHEGKIVRMEDGEVDEGEEEEKKSSVGGESGSANDSQSLQQSEIDLDIPFQAPQFYIARVDFCIAMEELPVIFKGYREEDLSLFRDIYMRMDDLGSNNLSFKDMVICIVLLKCPDITSCFLNAFKVYDYEKKELLERKE